jgi:Flp pilus assembly protein TadD
MNLLRFSSRPGLLPMLLLVSLLSACAGDKPSGYGLAPNGPPRAGLLDPAVAGGSTVPDTPAMYRSLIERMQSQGLFFASLAHISQFELQFGVTPESTLLRARAQRETGQLDQSELAYRSLVGGAMAAPAWHGLGLIAGARGDYAGAAAALAEATRRAPTDAIVLNDYGYALLRAGQVGAAKLPIAQAAELEPANAKIVANLALYLRVTGEVARADAVMERAALAPATRAAVIKLAGTIRGELLSRAAPASESAPLVARHAPVVGNDNSPVSGRPMPPLLERLGAEPR